MSYLAALEGIEEFWTTFLDDSKNDGPGKKWVHGDTALTKLFELRLDLVDHLWVW